MAALVTTPRLCDSNGAQNQCVHQVREYTPIHPNLVRLPTEQVFTLVFSGIYRVTPTLKQTRTTRREAGTEAASELSTTDFLSIFIIHIYQPGVI